jgi:serine/threonine-protein kinase
MDELQDRLGTALRDKYRIVRELGGGGMSRVFVAEDVQLGRKVVLKVLPPDLAAGVVGRAPDLDAYRTGPQPIPPFLNSPSEGPNVFSPPPQHGILAGALTLADPE